MELQFGPASERGVLRFGPNSYIVSLVCLSDIAFKLTFNKSGFAAQNPPKQKPNTDKNSQVIFVYGSCGAE